MIEKPNNGWISIDDELPTVPDVYMVHCGNTINFQYDKESIMLIPFHPLTGWRTNVNITHWQPLPQPPKD